MDFSGTCSVKLELSPHLEKSEEKLQRANEVSSARNDQSCLINKDYQASLNILLIYIYIYLLYICDNIHNAITGSSIR